MSYYYIVTRKFVCGVHTDDNGIIVDTDSNLKDFRGQHIDNLKRWVKEQEGKIQKI